MSSLELYSLGRNQIDGRYDALQTSVPYNSLYEDYRMFWLNVKGFKRFHDSRVIVDVKLYWDIPRGYQVTYCIEARLRLANFNPLICALRSYCYSM